MEENAIIVNNVSKKFRIYHETRNSIYEIIIGWFNQRKYYEDLNVFENLNFSIKKGEVFGIIGKNGAGKTTLLRIISRIYKPETGKITVNGKIIPILSLGTGFQVELTAKTNIIQYGILLGFTKKEIEKRVDEIIKFAELEKFADTKLKNFSSGMYARLAFSTAIQIDPDIIIIDEILQVGDVGFQKKSFEAILNFRNRGKTIIIVTHNLNAIKEFCDRAMFLNNKKIEYIGEPSEAVKRYLNN